MKVVLIILGILITLFVVFFAQYNEIALALAIPYTKIEFKTSFFAVSTGIFCLGVLVGMLFLLKGVFESSAQTGKVKRQLEKVRVGADDSELKVKTLENKVQTLELALKKALNQEAE